VTVVVPVVRNAMVRALRLAGRRRGGGRPAAGTEALGQRLDTARAGITRLRPKSFRCQLTRALGLQRRITPKRARRTSMTSTDDDLSHSCGGDMSTPQKCLPTRHYLQTTSDNRRSVSRMGPPACRPAPYPNGAFCAREW
jgi:hypothetical protein